MQVEAATKIRILMADDHPIVMQGFASSLVNYEIEIAGQVKTAEEAISQYQQLQPDVVILDIRFGGKPTGLDVARQMIVQFPGVNIIFLSQFDQITLIKEAYKLGVKAFITKDCSALDLAAAIRTAATGQPFFLPVIAERLANLVINGDGSPQSRLDPRQIAIFTLMAEGLTNVEMAEHLALSPRTISIFSQAIKDKLGLHRPADITRLAVKHGLIEP